MKLDDNQILSIVGNELSMSVGGEDNDFIEQNRENALATYLGQPLGNEIEGRSAIVSTDVADAIEWIMPEIVKAFTQNNEVVTFDPCYDGDEDQAELESQYVYDILMKENNGFIVIHQFIKDALMQKNGFIKCFYNEEISQSTETYTGVTQNELQVLLADPEIELLEQSTEIIQNIESHDIKVARNINNSKIAVVSVPPEEFRVNSKHNSVDLTNARFSAHVYVTTAGELLEKGYAKELVDSIGTYGSDEDTDYRFYMQNETVYDDFGQSLDPSLRPIEISECYMHIDCNGDGIAEFMKVEVAGGDSPDVLLDIEPIVSNPFISSTAILMSHKLFGLSIYDRLKEIQLQKTTLWRNIFDNMYLQNNQRTVIVENQVNIDDLMLSRPGGIIRAKRPDAVQPYVTPPLPGDTYKMMDYLDQVRAARSGASPDGPITDSMIGDRVGSEGVDRMMNQKEELVGLMIRVIAETGIKPLCYKIRDEVKMHQDVAKEYMFRGQWVKVNPSMWRNRSHTTVRVGTGSGNRKEAAGALTTIMTLQEKLMMDPNNVLVTPNQIFNSINDFSKAFGFPSARKYILDPKSEEGMKNAEEKGKQAAEAQQMQQQQEIALAQAQVKIANAEEAKAKADMKNVDLTAQNNNMKNQIDAMKTQADAEMAMMKQQLAEANTLIQAEGKGEELDYKYWDAREKHEIAREQIAATAKAAADNNKESNSGSDKD